MRLEKGDGGRGFVRDARKLERGSKTITIICYVYV